MAHILILEDEMHLLKILSHVMQGYGTIYATDNGPDAVRVFGEAMAAGEPFTLALLDIMLPGMDGHEVLRHIRRIEEEYRRDGLDGAKVIMVTALDTSSNIFQAFRDNCEAYITKPFEIQALVQTVQKLGFTTNDRNPEEKI